MSGTGTAVKKAVADRERKLGYDIAMAFWRMGTQIFFREIRPRGAFNIPKMDEGPVIFVGAPHNNQFLDMLLGLEVYRETHRRVRFLVAAKSMSRHVIGFFSRILECIPVARAADSVKPGSGKIKLSPDDPCRVIGIDTKFTKEFEPKMQIMLNKTVGSCVAEVAEIISDTEMKIKKEFGGEKGKGTSRIREKCEELDDGALEYKRMPFVDQGVMYKHVYQCLQDGGSIGIFPEGGSHDRTDLLPLKAGVSIMALGAMANDPNCKVKIVPVGLSYFHPHRFRSRAVVEFGTAIEVPPEFVEMFKEGGERKRTAVSGLLDLIYDALKTVTIRAPDYDTLMLIQAVRRLYKTPGQHLTLGQVVELNKRLISGYEHFKDEPRIQQLRKDVLKYNRLLRDLGLRDHQVPRAKKAGWKTFGLLSYRLALLSLWTILALPGTVLNAPIFILGSIISRKKAKEALAASTVKIKARDVLATWKVLIALGVAPILYTFYACVATYIAIRSGAPIKWRIATPFIVASILPFMNYASLKFGEAGMDVLKSLRPLIVSLVPGQQRSLNKLKTMREQLSNEVAEVINSFGPTLYEDFDEWRILVPSASAPPSSGTPGIWRRKSSTGAVDAQGLALSHPMTWIDERLFGWSRSANRGTSAWGGWAHSDSTDPSRLGTPNDSDDEDTGDYDHVLRVIDDHHHSTSKSSRSRTGSYADLQRLRATAPLTPYAAGSTSLEIPKPGSVPLGNGNGNGVSSPADELDGLHFRSNAAEHHRMRKSSLGDLIPVEKIAGKDGHEPFQDMTAELNTDAQQSKGTKGRLEE